MSDIVDIRPIASRRQKFSPSSQSKSLQPSPASNKQDQRWAGGLRARLRNHTQDPRSKTDANSDVTKKTVVVQAAESTGEQQSDKFPWGNYWRTTPVLILGVFFYCLLWMLVTRTSPEIFANWLFPDSYLLVQLLLAGGNWAVFAYLFQQPRWGSWLTLVGASFLFFRFNHFLFTPVLTLSLLVLAVNWWFLLIGRRPRKSSDIPEASKT